MMPCCQTQNLCWRVQLLRWGLLTVLCTWCCVPRVAVGFSVGPDRDCVDVSAAAMSNKTGGTVRTCAVAKQDGLCARDPSTAQRLCPVLGCFRKFKRFCQRKWVLNAHKFN